jgi:hypothetical protein
VTFVDPTSIDSLLLGVNYKEHLREVESRTLKISGNLTGFVEIGQFTGCGAISVASSTPPAARLLLGTSFAFPQKPHGGPAHGEKLISVPVDGKEAVFYPPALVAFPSLSGR